MKCSKGIDGNNKKAPEVKKHICSKFKNNECIGREPIARREF